MLGLILDVFILLALIRLITGDEGEGWGKPAVIALLASFGMAAATFNVDGAADSALWILLGVLVGIGAIVALGCFAFINIPLGKSALIAGGFVLYKTLFVILVALLMAA